MNRYLSAVTNDRGSALLLVVIMIPVLTLLCIFASNVSVQDILVTANDKCHRYAVYDADGAIYGTAKLVSLIAKSNTRAAVEEGEGEAAPGIEYLNAGGGDPADFFARMVSNNESSNTTEDVKFVKTTDTATDPDEKDFGLGSTVDIEKDFSENIAGGGAEFGNTSGGIGAQINRIRFSMRADASNGAACPNTNVRVDGDYWLIVTKEGQTKGI
jgi:Tfp pilus assembly protein PilX